MGCSQPGSSVHGIFQARMLKWFAIPFSRGSLRPRDCLLHFCIVVQLLSHIRLFSTLWTAAHQTSLSFTISLSFLNLMSIESVITFNHLILCHSSCPQFFPASGSFPMSWLFESGGQSTGASALAPVFPMNIQGWFPLGLTDLISLQAKGLSSLLQHHSLKASILWHSVFFTVQLSHSYMTTGKTTAVIIGPFLASCLYFLIHCLGLSLLFFQGGRVLISWLQSLSTLILEPKKIKSVTASIFSTSICHEVNVEF